MFVVETRHSRRFVARVDAGEEVVQSLKKLCESERIRAGWIRATGHLEWAELVHWDPEREAETRPRRVGGPLLAVALEGNVSMRMGEPAVVLRGALSRETDAGLELIGGQLVAASALALELVLEGFEDARLERDEDPPTGLSLWKGERTPGVIARARSTGASSPAAPVSAPAARPAPAPALPSSPSLPIAPVAAPAASAAVPATPSGWAQVAAVSAEVERVQPLKTAKIAHDELDDAILEPKKGDWVEHRQFGLCRVDGEDAEGALVIRLPSGQRKHIKLDVLEVLPPRHDSDRRIFPLRPRVRR